MILAKLQITHYKLQSILLKWKWSQYFRQKCKFYQNPNQRLQAQVLTKLSFWRQIHLNLEEKLIGFEIEKNDFIDLIMH